MKNFFRPITLRWWQVGIFKVGLISFGILLALAWPWLFEGWITVLLAVMALSWIYLLFLWFKN